MFFSLKEIGYTTNENVIFFVLYRMARNVQQIESERDELELTLKSKVMEIEKLKDKCFEMEEEHLILQVI